MGIQVIGHSSFLGHTGYNNHSRNFFTNLNNYIPTRVRNYSHVEDISYLKPEEYKLIIQQQLDGHPLPVGLPLNINPDDVVVDLVLNESHHYFFYDQYDHPMIAYNVWESTKQLPEYFNRILEYDQFWCPTKWQADCTIAQGYPEDRVKIIPEGVNGNLFCPSDDSKEKELLYRKYGIPKDAFTYMIFGRWDYRKSTKEMVEAWIYATRGLPENCYLIISADNPFSTDGMKSTEERMTHYKLEHERIKIIHFPPRDEYIKWMKHGSCLLSCSRSEGWNLPLLESLSCGTPAIASNWGGHLEFADGIAYLVDVPKELPPKQVFMIGDDHDLGVWGEPDFDQLSTIIEDMYFKYNTWKSRTVKLSKMLRNYYTWDMAARKAEMHIKNLVKNKYHYIDKSNMSTPKVSFVTSFFNSSEHITDISSSVLNQTFEDWEWIITDDYSSDDTKEKLKLLCDLDDRIKYIDQQSKQEIYWNPHKYANGEYILTVDADDQLYPKTAEVIVHFFEKHPDVSCIHTSGNYFHNNFDETNFKNSSFCNFDNNETILEKHPKYIENKSGYERVGFMFGVIRAYRNPGPYFNFNDGPYELGKHEDLVKLVRLEELGHTLYLNRSLYKIRMHENSHSGSWGDVGGITDFEKIYEKARKRRRIEYGPDNTYNSIREPLYAFLQSDLNEETDRKIISCLNFRLSESQQKLIKDIYYDHDVLFDTIPAVVDYIFVMMKESLNLDLFYEHTQIPDAKITYFMVNDSWEPSFYELEDSSNYFPLFDEVKEYFLDKIIYVYLTYLYKYCYINYTVPPKEKIKLNLGCGNDIKSDYINIDRYNNTGNVDMKCDLGALPFKNNSVDEIYTSHVFEHIMINDVYGVLEEWNRVLTSGGEVIIHVPNLEREVKIWLEAPPERKWFEVHRIFGSQSHDGNTHFNGHTPESLKWLLEEFNFEVTQCKIGNSGYGEEIQLHAKKLIPKRLSKPECVVHFVEGPFAEIKGDPNDKGFYLFDFLDPDNDSNVHQQMMTINRWTRPHRKYYTNWNIQIRRNGKLICDHKMDLKDKNVLISLDSKSLGDNIAWVPYVREFQDKHGCNVIVSTFWNKLFKDAEEFQNIRFIEPGQSVSNLYASYKIGCFDNDLNRNKNNWRDVPLQQVASDFLGLEYKEIIPSIGVPIGERPIKENYVAISEYSTFQSKFWNYPGGWQAIVNYLNEIGLQVVSISKENTNLSNVIKMNDRPIEETINAISHSEFFMGVSAGPTWLAWALRKPTILISGYSAKWGEFKTDCQRVINENVCHGCFNDPTVPLDRGDWKWCPRLKGTDRQFECSKHITPEMVMDAVQNILTSKTSDE